MVRYVDSSYFFASEIPEGLFAGCILVHSRNPPLASLLSRQGKNMKLQELLEQLFSEGFRYFCFAYKGQIYEIVDVAK
jgi:hypothetical protein